MWTRQKSTHGHYVRWNACFMFPMFSVVSATLGTTTIFAQPPSRFGCRSSCETSQQGCWVHWLWRQWMVQTHLKTLAKSIRFGNVTSFGFLLGVLPERLFVLLQKIHVCEHTNLWQGFALRLSLKTAFGCCVPIRLDQPLNPFSGDRCSSNQLSDQLYWYAIYEQTTHSQCREIESCNHTSQMPAWTKSHLHPVAQQDALGLLVIFGKTTCVHAVMKSLNTYR